MKRLYIVIILVLLVIVAYIVKSKMCVDILPHRHLIIFKE